MLTPRRPRVREHHALSTARPHTPNYTTIAGPNLRRLDDLRGSTAAVCALRRCGRQPALTMIGPVPSPESRLKPTRTELSLYTDACTYRKPANSSSMRDEISSARRTHVDTRNQFAGNAPRKIVNNSASRRLAQTLGTPWVYTCLIRLASVLHRISADETPSLC